MQDKIAEQLSAYLDGELNADEQRFLARRLAADEQAREQLSRYHRISAVIRGDYHAQSDQLADRVSSALANEPEHEALDTPTTPNAKRWSWLVQPVAGMAIAASVALGIVAVYPIIADNLSSPSINTSEVAQAPSDAGARSASGALAQVGSQSVPQAQSLSANTRLDAAQRHRLNPYFVNHSEHASSTRLGGTLKYIRIVGHDTNQ